MSVIFTGFNKINLESRGKFGSDDTEPNEDSCWTLQC